MKKFFHAAMILSFTVMVACNNIGDKSDHNATGDSATVVNDNTSGNDVLVSKELPMKANQEVPTNDSYADGTADVTYNKATKVLTYTLNWKGLTDKAMMAHIHGTAPRGTNAGVKHDLTNMLEKETSGSFTDSVKIDASDIKEDSLLAGFYYFNIHTSKHPAGEIRAQIEFK